MDEQNERVAELQSKTAKVNFDFIEKELDAGVVAVDVASRELALGHPQIAHEKIEKAEHAYKAVIGFVAELDDERQRSAIEKRWNDLRAQLDVLQTLFKETASE